MTSGFDTGQKGCVYEAALICMRILAEKSNFPALTSYILKKVGANSGSGEGCSIFLFKSAALIRKTGVTGETAVSALNSSLSASFFQVKFNAKIPATNSGTQQLTPPSPRRPECRCRYVGRWPHSRRKIIWEDGFTTKGKVL